MDHHSPLNGAVEALHGAHGGSSSTHVLVVDDKQVVRDFLREVLELAGHRVTLAADGPEAIEACRREAPHVLLTDLAMQPMSGRDLIEALKKDYPSVVSVVLTGYGTVERTVELMRIGAFDVLTKPCRAAEITATVDKALEHHQALETNRDLRERLRVQDRLAMIGRLAAGVAHELNNPLDAVLRCVRLTRDRVKADPEATEYLELAYAGLTRMADIVQSLLTFSRNAAVEQAPQALASLVEEAVTQVAMALGEDAPRVERRLDSDAARMTVPRGMHQVLTNLLKNSFDATGSEGSIRVTGATEGAHLVIRVEDDGPGIPPDVLPRVFEPFFTTKEPGKGTGLGLPISARLVEKFGGTIRIECPPEGGTVVIVSLPAHHAAPEAA